MPPKASKTRNATNRDTTHDKGLAPPGKRLPRQRSNGQLNGQANGKSTSAIPPPALPSTGLNQGFKFPRSADASSTGYCVSAAAAAKEHAATAEGTDRDRTPSDASLEEMGPRGEMVDTTPEAVTPLLEVPLVTADRATNTRSGAAPYSVSTILYYYPLRDAISILILLLSLPPTLVLVIQALFASLTFVPPTAGISLSTLPNIKEMFNSPNFGYPAMATILLVDLFAGVFWAMLWKPAQAIILDLSQAVIAVSLGGAAASTGGPTYSIAMSTLLVCIVHVLRYKAIHLTALDYLRSVYHSTMSIPHEPVYFAKQFHSSPILDRGMVFNAMRAILGIHIVSQGVLTCVRRTLANAKASEKDSLIPLITKTDTEAIAGAEPSARSSTGLAETPQPSHAVFANDGRPPGQPPAQRESRARESSSRKKRKQANQIRSQQPLWAAIASTKVTFVKEMEQRDAADDAREASAMTNNTSNSYINAINSVTDRIWVCEVRDTEILFAVDLSMSSAVETVNEEGGSTSIPTGIDRSKPFFIRINGATWTSTRILSSEEAEKTGGNSFVGEIFGLAPLSSYHCEVVSIAQQRTLCSASLITQPAPTAEQAAAVPVPLQHQALRPASPITTLKQSVQSAEAKLNEIRNRSRKAKKDQRGAHADIKKEIQTLKNKLSSSTDVDEKQEKRLQQISQHKNQAEEATKEIQEQIEALGEIPSGDISASNALRKQWQSALNTLKAAQQELDAAKAEQERDISSLKSEITASESRRERLATRIAQRGAELEKLNQQQQAEMTAKQKREFERLQALNEREHRENVMRSAIAHLEEQVQAENTKAFAAYQESAALTNFAGHAPPNSSQTPPLPGTANGNPSYGPHVFGSPFSGNANGSGVPRGRSSSMLSQYSGFTDNGEDFHYAGDHRAQHSQSHAWPAHGHAVLGASEDRKASEGDSTGSSGSQSGSTTGGSQNGSAGLIDGASILNGVLANGSNSPRPEAKPFIPAGFKASPGVIGPPVKKTPPQSPSEHHAHPGSSGR
ncbi:hypothetical protein Slin15195_G128350 [Septoria linicola]|uniref:Ubiquitination network signaling protein n=1 Tax=Septoria linicola TaxID=215465 RepID=A0A9Q9BAS8_9PEZI|nr:hypothetical protein Slin15195_G128350 [Septoria linicola]